MLNFNTSNEQLPQNLSSYLQERCFSKFGGIEKFVWKHTTDGVYFVKSGYNVLVESSHTRTRRHSQSNKPIKWEGLWKSKVPYRISMFIWNYKYWMAELLSRTELDKESQDWIISQLFMLFWVTWKHRNKSNIQW